MSIFKAAIMIGLAICLALLYACKPSTEYIETQVKGKLQTQISTAMPETKDNVVVSSVTVVNIEGNKYQGVANIVAYNTPLSLKLNILADSKNIIYDTGDSDWKLFLMSAHQSKFKTLSGKTSDVASSDEAIFESFPDTLRKVRSQFAERLQVVQYIEQRNNYLFGSGCKAHACNTDAAAWAIDQTTGKGSAILETTRTITGFAARYLGKNTSTDFAIYASSIAEIPPPLLQWATERGMTDRNSVVIRLENAKEGRTEPGVSKTSNNKKEKIALHYNKDNQAYSLTGLCSFDKDVTDCAGPVTWMGTIVDITYDDNNAKRVNFVTIDDDKGNRVYPVISDPKALYEGLSIAELEYIGTIIKKGNRVQVKSYGCGAAGHVEMLDAITLIRLAN